MLADRCECDWKWHSGEPCPNPPADHGDVVMLPSMCMECLFVCCGERDDELEAPKEAEYAH